MKLEDLAKQAALEAAVAPACGASAATPRAARNLADLAAALQHARPRPKTPLFAAARRRAHRQRRGRRAHSAQS